MDSYLSIAQVVSKNKNLIKNLNTIQISYKKLSIQEKRLTEYIENIKAEFTREKERINEQNEKEKTILIEEFNNKIIQKEEEQHTQNEKISASVIESKNEEIEKSVSKIKCLEDEIKY